MNLCGQVFHFAGNRHWEGSALCRTKAQSQRLQKSVKNFEGRSSELAQLHSQHGAFCISLFLKKKPVATCPTSLGQLHVRRKQPKALHHPRRSSPLRKGVSLFGDERATDFPVLVDPLDGECIATAMVLSVLQLDEAEPQKRRWAEAIRHWVFTIG